MLFSSLYTLYLFTVSDFIAVLLPQASFALFSMLSNEFVAPASPLASSAICSRMLRVILWIWLQLLVLDIANQRLPDSVAEDRINKPWRPIASCRITAEGARWLLAGSIVVNFATSYCFGVASQTLLLFTLNWIYNDLGMANTNWFTRNLLNAVGITAIGAGASGVACEGMVFLIDAAARWWLLCAAMLLTTIHAQDLYDQEGDAARQRSTVPLVYGDPVARWSVAVAVLFWSVVMPASLGSRLNGHGVNCIGTVLLGMLVAARILILRGVAEDKRTFGCWAAWTISVYSLPYLAV
ncbi:hypothetical protein F5Y14DRAFT_394688 [Nemania sp. NC0429]|nr:hypothetical protein F5Y14DRAFT_394688 [Nemania sp. NC0429]